MAKFTLTLEDAGREGGILVKLRTEGQPADTPAYELIQDLIEYISKTCTDFDFSASVH